MKTNLTNPQYQNKFLKEIERATIEIKKLILYYAMKKLPKNDLQLKIKGIITSVGKRIPLDLPDRVSYLYGLQVSSDKMIREIYDPILNRYYFMLGLLLMLGIKAPKNPIELIKTEKTHESIIYKGLADLPTENPYKRELWSKQKGSPYVSNYYSLVKKKVNELAETIITSNEPIKRDRMIVRTPNEVNALGKVKKPISLWQKAEMDIRHEHQLDKLNEIVSSGTQYAFTSSHPNCSKRCQRWQGKLFDIQAEKSELSGFRMKKKIDGHTVYCLKEVLNQVDKYGYKNNIINGYNCRHYLIPYKGQIEPEKYSADEIAEQREINAKLRQYERTIRLYKQKSILYNDIDKQKALEYKRKVETLTQEYMAFANKYGYAYYPDRL